MRPLKILFGPSGVSEGQTYMFYDLLHGKWDTLVVRGGDIRLGRSFTLSITPTDLNMLIESVCSYSVDGRVTNIVYGTSTGLDLLVRPRTIYLVLTDMGPELVVPLYSFRERRWYAYYQGSIRPMDTTHHAVLSKANATPFMADPCTSIVSFVGTVMAEGGVVSVEPIYIPIRDYIDALRRAILKNPGELTPEEVRVLTVHWRYWSARAMYCESTVNEILSMLRSMGIIGGMIHSEISKTLSKMREMISSVAGESPQQQQQQQTGI